jgi:hypothetical protein
MIKVEKQRDLEGIESESDDCVGVEVYVTTETRGGEVVATKREEQAAISDSDG